MSTIHRLRPARFVALFFALVLVAAACGGGSETEPADATAPTNNVEVLPPNNNPGNTPAVQGVCAPGEPDCVDTVVVDDQPQDLPSDAGGVSVGGVLANGGLTVSEAIATDATGIIAVQGFLLDDGTSARLCEVLAESYPPQCGGASIQVANYETAAPGPLSTSQGVIWSDGIVVLFGEMVDGTLVVNPNVTG